MATPVPGRPRRWLRRPDPAAVAARRVRAFGARHAVDGDAAVACALEHVGRGAVRLVLVARDGTLGDLVLREEHAARAAELAGADVGEATSRELARRIRTGPYEWVRAAGSQLGGGRARR